MESIKVISGKVLLYFYALQRSDYTKLHDLVLEFQMRHFSDVNIKSPRINQKENEVVQNLLKISHNDNDIYNALKYLGDKGFIEMIKNSDNTSDNFLNFSVSSMGIDIIEGIERGSRERKEFNFIFNIKLADNVSIESLFKASLI